MVSTLLVIGAAVVGLLVLLAVIVALSARPAGRRGSTTAGRTPDWVADHGRKHPDAWAPVSSTQIQAIR
jgi:hypothetical protein